MLCFQSEQAFPHQCHCCREGLVLKTKSIHPSLVYLCHTHLTISMKEHFRKKNSTDVNCADVNKSQKENSGFFPEAFHHYK